MPDTERLSRMRDSRGGALFHSAHGAPLRQFVPRETRLRLGITEGLVRFSAGVEDLADILDDLAPALEGA